MMKAFLFFLLLLCKLWASPLEIEGKPSPALIELLDLYQLPHQNWEEIVQVTQNTWIRKGVERSEMTSSPESDPQKTYALFSQLGMVEAVHGSGCYERVLILGSTRAEMTKRLLFLKREWARGVRFKELVFLVGDRPLNPATEGNGGNETGMAKLLFDDMAPLVWKKLPVTFVDTPRKPGQRRPTTLDTFEEWLSTNPTPGRTLVLSGQPFIPRQGLIAAKMLPTWCVETVGNGFSFEEYTSHPAGLAILLDELARWIYETYSKKCN